MEFCSIVIKDSRNMIQFYVDCRPSDISGAASAVSYSITADRFRCILHTKYELYPCEWDGDSNAVIIPVAAHPRHRIVKLIVENIIRDKRKAEQLVAAMCHVQELKRSIGIPSFILAMELDISMLCRLGRRRTAEAYMSARNSFFAFSGRVDTDMSSIDSSLVRDYEMWLKSRGVTLNTISFYMRILRAVYNRAVSRGWCDQRHPFKDVYTGSELTAKRALSLQGIRSIKCLPLSHALEWARDMFMFSFYTRGMSFVDMAHLLKTDLKFGVLSYQRRKTGQFISIKWEPCMERIVRKYESWSTGKYLLPILPAFGRMAPSTYRNRMCKVNRMLKVVGRMAGIERPLSMYVARHSWASIAKANDVPIAVISEAMGHDSERTTLIYLASFDNHRIDDANAAILNMLE